MRSPDPCSSHTPHGARHTHVSDHRRSSLDLPDLANSAALPPPTYPLIFSPPCLRKGKGAAADRACSPLRSGPLNAPEFPVRAPYDNFSPPWASKPHQSHPCRHRRSTPHATVATAKHRTESNPDSEHVALCSTSQGTTIQNCLSTRGSAATCSGICALRTDSSTNKYCATSRQTSFFQLSQKEWKSVRDEMDQLEEKVITDRLNNEGWICVA